MYNIYLLILSWICCLQIFFSSNAQLKMNQASFFIDTALIEDCLDLDSLLSAGEMGFNAIELNQSFIKKYVKETLENNFFEFHFDLYYYFYDAKTCQNCNITDVPCNSVQIKIIITYQTLKTEKIIRYELKERN